MSVSFLQNKFPTNDETDGRYLYRSLGSFWTQVFSDKNVLKGYTLGLAEELIQQYVNLAEVVRQYSIKDVDVLHTENWQPLIIKKSTYNKTYFTFEADGPVFGAQPETDRFYAGKLFRFGQPKETDARTIFSYTPDVKLRDFGVIANRIIAPSFFLVSGVDVVLDRGVLYFNKDIFQSSMLHKSKLIDESGNAITYRDSSGNIVEDEFVTLWVYKAKIDKNYLYDNFSAIFDIPLESTDNDKALLKAVMNLYVNGATVSSLTSFLAVTMRVPVIIEAEETVEQIYQDDLTRFVITDKNVYKFNSDIGLKDGISENSVLHAGDLLTDNVKLVDNVISRSWWLHELKTKKLAFTSHVFAANPKYQLFFENTLRLVTYSNDRINFPVIGREEDVQAFQDYINLDENRTFLLEKLNISPSHASRPINPLDFVFENLFKNNTLLLSLNFNSEEHLAKFFAQLYLLLKHIPPHVYLLVYVNMSLKNDTLRSLNNGLAIDAYPGDKFSLDGSVPHSGARPGSKSSDDDYYKDYVNRMFCISLGPLRNNLPLHNTANLDILNCNSHVVDGSIWTQIPLEVVPPGQQRSRIPTTREIQNILLIDF
jgi:hypothetical protein